MLLFYTLLITLLVVWILTLAGVLFLAWNDHRNERAGAREARQVPPPRRPAPAD